MSNCPICNKKLNEKNFRVLPTPILRKHYECPGCKWTMRFDTVNKLGGLNAIKLHYIDRSFKGRKITKEKVTKKTKPRKKSRKKPVKKKVSKKKKTKRKKKR